MQFTVTLTNVLIMVFYMVPGYIIHKMKKTSAEHLSTLSAVLIYIGTPFLEVSTFLSLDFSLKDLSDLSLFFIISFLVQAIFMLILFLINKPKYEQNKYRILTIGSTMGNVGFFGLPIIRALFPAKPEVACFSAAYMVSMNILVFTLGAFCITKEKRFISIKAAICNPTVFGFVIALPMYIFSVKNFLPTALITSIQSVANITTPLCMFILGIRLASVSLKTVFGNPMTYVICAMKLLIFPLFAYFLVLPLPLSYEFKTAMLVLSGTPCAAVILSLSEIYHGETSLPANSILVSSVLSVITLPLLTLIL